MKKQLFIILLCASQPVAAQSSSEKTTAHAVADYWQKKSGLLQKSNNDNKQHSILKKLIALGLILGAGYVAYQWKKNNPSLQQIIVDTTGLPQAVVRNVMFDYLAPYEYTPGSILEGEESWLTDAIAFTDDGSRAVTVDLGGIANSWDIKTGTHAHTGHPGRVTPASALHPQGTQVLTSYNAPNRTTLMHDTATGNAIRTFTGHTKIIAAKTFDPTGKYIASTSADRTARIWSAATGQLIRTLQSPDLFYTSVAFSPDSKYIACGALTVDLWEVNTEKLIRTFKGHKDWVYSVDFSSDGQYLATASGDKTARIWDIKTKKLLQTLKGHQKQVKSVRFNADGNFVVTTSDDKTVRIWSFTTGQNLQTLPENAEAAIFSPDDSTLLTRLNDGNAHIWHGIPKKSVEQKRHEEKEKSDEKEEAE